MNTIWRVPRNERPNPLRARLRSVQLLVVVGLSVVGTTILSALSSSAHTWGTSVGTGLQILLVLASMAANAIVFTVGFKIATARRISWRCTLPGAIFAAVVWQALQFFGTTYIGHIVKHASVINSVFALVLGLIAWIYVGALVVVFAVEYNAVREMTLYPRALLTPFTDNVQLTAADETAYSDQAQAQRAKGFQEIDVSFDPPTP